MPPGVITSQAMIESASSTPGMPKLRTSRDATPAPRSSTGTSAAPTWRNGGVCRSAARAPQIATLAGPPTAVTVSSQSREA